MPAPALPRRPDVHHAHHADHAGPPERARGRPGQPHHQPNPRPHHRPHRRPLTRLALRCTALCCALLVAPWAHAGLPEVVAAAKPAVVAVGTYNELANPRFGFRGTGFIVGDGQLLVTNAHVLPPPGTSPEPQLVLHVPGSRPNNEGNGDTRRLSLVALDRAHDLALLRFGGHPLPTLKLAPDGSAREGQAIALIGFPIGSVLGFSHVTHSGIISSITPIVLPPANARQLDAAAVARLRAGVFNILQLDAIAYPGNSGGPLLDVDSGEVLGVVNMVVVKSTRESALTDPTGISYALPVRYVHALIDRR